MISNSALNNFRPSDILEARLSSVIMNLNVAILVEDENRKVLLVNQIFIDMFQIPATVEQMIGVDCSNAAEQSMELFMEPDLFVYKINDILLKKIQTNDEQVIMRNGMVLLRDYTPMFLNNTYLGHMWSYRDITRLVRQQQIIEQQTKDLLKLVNIDYLTSAYNRRYLIEYLKNYNFHTAGLSLGLLMIDIDDFKKINDTYGHANGDLVIKNLVELASSEALGCDFIARYGGEEFVFLAHGLDEKGLLNFAQHLCKTIESQASPYKYTVSIGVSLLPNTFRIKPKWIDQLLDIADINLYKAKMNGKNQAIMEVFNEI